MEKIVAKEMAKKCYTVEDVQTILNQFVDSVKESSMESAKDIAAPYVELWMLDEILFGVKENFIETLNRDREADAKFYNKLQEDLK